MTAEQKEQLSLSLLRFLETNQTRFGLPSRFLWQMAKAEGRMELTAAETEAQLQYLAGKGLVEEALKGIHPENRSWRITSDGIDFVACGGPP